VVFAGSNRIGVIVPEDAPGGRATVTVDGAAGQADLEIGAVVARAIHQVDNPAIASAGTLYVTCSGRRGQQVPVSVVRVGADGVQEPYLSGIVNATSLAFDAHGALHVSSRYDGNVYRVKSDHTFEVAAGELGVACGIAFGSDGTLFVGDRSGTIFRIGEAGRVLPFVTLPPSVVAYHLAIGPDDDLFVAAPTLDSCDRVYRIRRSGDVQVISTEFGRPQGLACDAEGRLYVSEAVAGGAGLYLVRDGHPRELVMAAPVLVGVAFDPRGGLVVASSDTVYRLDVPLRPWAARGRKSE
jgi:sugar lactone lactonase YvrE